MIINALFFFKFLTYQNNVNFISSTYYDNQRSGFILVLTKGTKDWSLIVANRQIFYATDFS